ncbi:hypothetical protein HGG78_17210 [Vibrio aestuarianus]|uniref:hypothetical protein n=1 Tax=Vibrio aestuarianus TaxID=28171 RepID=UPI00155942B6|nr:hypothetical protein [Vibrio aestuarianus]NGZ15468.1 hypothetical protein [Vibrio aestuarianus]NKZ51616.1 hypothetical protein [Vibrio aestuarianus]
MHHAIKICALALALFAGYFSSDILHWLSSYSTQRDISQYCQLSSKPCQQGEVSMTLAQDTSQPLVANTLTVDWPKAQSDKLVLSLKGLEMDMGIAKYVLTKNENGLYTTEVILPVCTTEQMTWIGDLSDGSTQVFPAIRMER